MVDEPLSRERLISLTEAHLDALQTGVPLTKYTPGVIRTDNGQSDRVSVDQGPG